MPQASRSKAGDVAPVALVLGGGDGLGRAVALALAARGARVMVAGADERAIARVVGEVTCGGGTARHAPGALSQAERVQAAIARTLEVFERLDVVVVGDPEVDPRPLARALEGKLTEPTARLLFLYPAPLDRWTGPAPCNAIVWTGGAEADLDNVGELAVFLCSRAAEGITRQTIALSS